MKRRIMGNNGDGKPNASGDLHVEPIKNEIPKPEPLKKQPLKMEITFSEETGIHVLAPGNGEFYNEPLCYFLLRKAERFIEDTNFLKSQDVAKNKVELAHPGIINRVRGAFGGGHK